MVNRTELIEAYAEAVIDSLDMDTLVVFATEKMREELEKYSDQELLEEITEFAPSLLDEDVN